MLIALANYSDGAGGQRDCIYAQPGQFLETHPGQQKRGDDGVIPDPDGCPKLGEPCQEAFLFCDGDITGKTCR